MYDVRNQGHVGGGGADGTHRGFMLLVVLLSLNLVVGTYGYSLCEN